MRKIVHGLMLHVTIHFLYVMRQFLYDVLCIHIHVTVHWLVRNTAVRPTRFHDFGILFLHYICFLTGYSMVNIASKGCYYFSPNRSTPLTGSIVRLKLEWYSVRALVNFHF